MPEKNLYKREATWWLRTTINGVEHRESLRTSDVRSARVNRDKVLAALEKRAASGGGTWAQTVTAWIDHVKKQIATQTFRRYLMSLKQCEPTIGPLTAIDAVDGKLIAKLISVRQKAGATPATIRRDLTAISRVLDYSEAQGWREGNPTLSKRRLLSERRDPIDLPQEPAIAMMLESSSPRFAALIDAARLTGCRQNELVTATWRAFNPRASTLEVIGKGNKRRTIALSPAAAKHIAAHPRTLNSDLIFCRGDGEGFTQAASDFGHIRREVEKKAKEEGLTFRRFRFHDLRHLFAVEALRGGTSLYRLSKHLGHTSVKTTEIYLAFLTPEEEERAKRGDGESAQNPAQP